MGLLYALSKGVAAAAKTGSDFAGQQLKEEAEARAADRKLKDAERLMAIQEAANARAEERRETLRRGGMQHDLEFKTNPDNVQAVANAEVQKHGVIAPGKAAVESSPQMLAAKRSIAQAGHIDSPLSLAQAAKLNQDLKGDKELQELYSQLDAAVEANDDAAVQKIRAKIDVRNQTRSRGSEGTALTKNVAMLRAMGMSQEQIENYIFNKKGTPIESIVTDLMKNDSLLSPQDAVAKAVEIKKALDAAQGKEVAAPKQIPKLPAGAKQIGTHQGKPVYQTPDGKRFIPQ
jgi:phage FluMu protein gp41